MSEPGQGLHLLLADSGLGGLSVCAALERRLRAGGRRAQPVRLSYFNAAPDSGRGYNDLPDQAQAELLDRTLAAIQARRPDRIVLACNTLSVVYARTQHARAHSARVIGIIDAGVRLFAGALEADPGGVLLLLGTRATIGSGVHRQRLLEARLAPGRIAAVACHGLARAIESDPDGPQVGELIGRCAASLPELAGRGERLYAGLACTHYGFAAPRLQQALQEAWGLPVSLLDPGEALAAGVAQWCEQAGAASAASAGGTGAAEVTVRVLSKVPLAEPGRRGIAARLRPVSEPTARALLSYTCDPDLF